MVTVSLNEYTSAPTVTQFTSLSSVGTTTHNTYYALGIWKQGTSYVTVPDGANMYYYASANDGGNSANQAYNKVATADESITAFTFNDTNGQSQQTYTSGVWTNNTGSSVDLYLFSRNYMPTQPNNTSSNGYVNSILIMTQADLASGWEEINLASLGSTVTELHRYRKLYIDKHYVCFQNNQCNLKIDGISSVWGSINQIPVQTIVPEIGFNWSYNQYNKIFYAYKGAGFVVSS